MISHDERLRWSSGDSEVRRLAGQVVDVLARRGNPAPVRMNQTLLTALREAVTASGSDIVATTVRHMHRMRVTPEAIADHYIPAIARWLGDDWASDRISFAECSIGVAKLQLLLRDVSAPWTPGEGGRDNRKAVLVVVPEGEDHTLGALVLTSRLRRIGVSVCLKLQAGLSELRDLSADRQFDAAMVSVANSHRLRQAADIVSTLRDAAGRDRAGTCLPVFVGGPVTGSGDDIAARTGADLVSGDVEAAIGRLSLDAVPGRAQRRA